MNKGSTLILKLAIATIGAIVLLLCAVFLPQALIAELSGDFDYGPILIGLYVTAVPFFIAVVQAFKLLLNIDNNTVFSEPSINALRVIKQCAITISAVFALGMPYVFYVADRDDAPGLAAVGFIIIAISFVVFAAAGLFQKLLQSAVAIKSENDLTV